MKNVRYATAQNHRLSGRILAFMLAFSMLLGVCPTVFADGAITGRVVFMDGSSELSSGAAVQTGKKIALNIETSFSDGFNAEASDVRLYIGDMAAENILAIPNGGKLTGATYMKDGIKYTVQKDNNRNENYLLIERLKEKGDGGFEDGTRPWKAGDTVVASLGVNFDVTAGNGNTWPVELVIGGKSYGTTNIVSSSSVTINNTKTADKDIIVLDYVSGETTLGQDIVYNLSVYTGSQSDNDQSLEDGEMPVTEYTVTDTLEFPSGIYIPSGTSVQDALAAGTGFTYDVVSTTTDASGNITGVTISYKVTSSDTSKQISDSKQQLTLKSDKVKVSNGFTSTTSIAIKNKISTEAKNIDNNMIAAAPVTVETGVRRPTAPSYLNEKKEIVSVGDKYGTSSDRFWNPNGSYVVKGDYILYKLSFKNGGDTPVSGAVITDTLPAGMEVVSNEEVSDAKSLLDNNYNWNSIINAPITINGGSANAAYSNDSKTVTIRNISVESGATFEAYILAKVTNDTTGILTNKAVFPDNQELTAVYNQKKTEPKLSISKSVTPTEYVVGQSTSVEYTVTVKNDGSAAAENVTLEDIFPSGLITAGTVSLSNNAKYTASAADDGATTTYSCGNLTIPAGESVIMTIAGTVKADTDDSIIVNTAKASLNGEEKTATATICKQNPASNVSITKVSNDTDGFVQAGDTISYTITVNTNGKTVYESDPLYVIDTVPSQLSYISADITENGLTVTDETSNNGGQPKFKLTGNGTAEITLNFTVNNDASSSFVNTASLVGGSSASSGTVTVGTPDQYTAVKSAKVFRNGNEVDTISAGEDKEIQAGDTIQFFIRVKNNSSEPLTNFTLKDQLVGDYVAEHNTWTDNHGQNPQTPGYYPIHMTICGVSDGVTGTDENKIWNWTGKYVDFVMNAKDGSYSESNGIITSGVKVSEFVFNTSDANNEGDVVHTWGNSSFKIPAGGYIDLTYTVTTASTFSTGSNTSRIGEGTASTVSYHIKADTPISPTAEPGASAAPTAVPAGPMPVLSIEKGAYSSAGIGENNRIYEMAYGSTADFGNIWDAAGELIYGVTITNHSDIEYKTTNATFMDFFPKGLGLKDDNKQTVWTTSGKNIASVKLAEVNENVDYQQAVWAEQSTLWDSNTANVYPQNAVAVQLCDYGTNELTIPAKQSINIIYVMRPRESLKNEILEEVKKATDGAFEFEPRHEMNTAYFTGDSYFKNTDGSVVRVIADTADIVIRAKSERPGLTKTAYASLNANENSINTDTTRAEPGARLIWKLRIDNAAGAGDTMKKYKLTDILPNGYKYIEGNTYTNTSNVKYPDALTDENLKTGKMIRHNSDGSIDDLPYITPTVNGKTLTWSFPETGDESETGDEIKKGYELKAGEWLEFTFITEPETAQTASGVYYNKAKLEVNGRFYEDTVSAGIAENGGVVDGDSFSLNSILTSSKISVDTGTDTAVGGTEDNIAKAAEGANVTYTLEVKNESTTEGLKNFAIINRLPYVGDSGVIVSGSRNSQFAVSYKDSMTVKVYGENGTDGTVDREFKLDELKITTYSADDSKVFNETSEDWEKTYMKGWTESFDDSTKLIRIQLPDGYIVPKGATVKVTYVAQVPATGSDTDTTAWNSFAYHYDAELSAAIDMAAEPAAVGVTLPKSSKLTGSIRVKKVWATGATDEASQTKTFYLSVYDNPYENGGKLVGKQSITLTSKGGLSKPVNAEVLFDNLEYVSIGKSKNFYIYETDENGVPIKQNYTSNGYAMCKGFYRTDKGEYINVYDANNKSDQAVTPTDTEAVQYVYATDESGSNRVEYVKEGSYCFWYKGLSSTQTTNSAIFSNLVRREHTETTQTIFGPYYSDIATNYESAQNTGSGYSANEQTTGVVRGQSGGTSIRATYDSNDKSERKINKTYESGREITASKQYVFGNGWGNAEGHTVATGFMAQVTGGSEALTINKVMWDIKSDPTNKDGVFVRLGKDELDGFSNKMASKGYKLTQAFADGEDVHGSTVYRIEPNLEQTSLTEAASSVDMSVSDEHESGVVNDDDTGSAVQDAEHDGISFDNVNDEVFNAEDESMLAEQAELNEAAKILNWKISDVIPSITLGEGTVINVGIIIDQLYDMNAKAEFVINPTETATNTAEGRKIKSYDKQADVPAFNLSGEYQALVISTVLKPLEIDKKYYLGSAMFETSGDITYIIADNNTNTAGESEPHFMICAGDYKDSKGNLKNHVTVNDRDVRVGSYQNSKDNYIVNKQPTPTIAVKIPKGGAKLTFNMTGGTAEAPRYLTILERNESGAYTAISEIKADGNKTNLPASTVEKPSIDISAASDRIVYITSTGANINIQSIEVAAYKAPAAATE